MRPELYNLRKFIENDDSYHYGGTAVVSTATAVKRIADYYGIPVAVYFEMFGEAICEYCGRHREDGFAMCQGCGAPYG